MATIFNSFHHQRYEYGRLVSDDPGVPRIVKIEYSPDKSKMIVSITPTLTPKPASLESQIGNIRTYRGADPDYRFVIEEMSGKIIRFSLFRLDRNLELRYFEY